MKTDLMSNKNLEEAIELLKYADKNKISITEAAYQMNISEKIARYVRTNYENKNAPEYLEFLNLYNKVLENQSKNLVDTVKKEIEVLKQEYQPLDKMDNDIFDKKGSELPSIEEEQLEIKDSGRTKEIDFRGKLHIKTLEQLINETNIDLNLWKIDRHIINKWDTTFVDKVTGEANVSQNFQVKAFLSVKENAIETFNAIEVYKELLREYKPLEYKKVKYDPKSETNLLEINIFDLHLGKLCWAGETGENYDVKIASKRFMDAIQALIARASYSSFERILFPVGNDFFNSDTILNTTTEGTPQDEDLRWQKTFKIGVQLLIKGIDYMRQYAPVDVVIIPGNHDMQRCFFLGETLAAWYRKDDDVKIDNGVALRKYYQYGKVLIGLTHGNNEKEMNLGQTMMYECKHLLGETDHLEWHLGHFHKKKVVKYPVLDENLGITVRYMSSLSGTDSWHFKKGYVGSKKAAEAYLWNKEMGYNGQFNVNITINTNEE